MSEDMRGLFFILKGRYRKGIAPSYLNRVSGETGWIGCYDPSKDTTEEWYQLLDRKCFHTISCGSDLDQVVNGLYKNIMKCKGQAKKYFKHVSEVSSDDYYEVTYLHHKPLTPDGYTKKAEGRCPRVSPVMREMYKEIDRLYGDYFSDLLREMEDKAYKELVDERPVNKSRKIIKKARKGLVIPQPDTGVTTNEKTTGKLKSKSSCGNIKNDISSNRLIRPEKRKSIKMLR